MKMMNTIKNSMQYDYFSYQPLPFYDQNTVHFAHESKKKLIKYKLDLNLYCIKRPQQTCFIQVNNPNMIAWGIEQGDMLVVEKKDSLQLEDLVVLEINNEFQLYECFALQNNKFVLLALDSKMENIKTADWRNLPIVGTVTSTIHHIKPKRTLIQ